MKRLFALTIVLISCSACASQAPASLDPVEYCLELLRLKCEANWSCCPTEQLRQGAVPLEECATGGTLGTSTSYQIICDALYRGVYDGSHLIWDGVVAAEEIAAMRDGVAGCRPDATVPRRSPLTTNLAPYDACTGNGLPGTAALACPSGTYCVVGACYPFATEGQECGEVSGERFVCDASLVCDAATATCVVSPPPAGLMQPCGGQIFCGIGLYCDDRDSTCHTLLTEGGLCALGSAVGVCAPGLYCDVGGTDRCVRLLPWGSPCDAATGPLCDGVSCTAGTCRERTAAELEFCQGG